MLSQLTMIHYFLWIIFFQNAKTDLVGQNCVRPSENHVFKECVETSSFTSSCFISPDCVHEHCPGLCEITSNSVVLFPCSAKFYCLWEIIEKESLKADDSTVSDVKIESSAADFNKNFTITKNALEYDSSDKNVTITKIVVGYDSLDNPDEMKPWKIVLLVFGCLVSLGLLLIIVSKIRAHTGRRQNVPIELMPIQP